MRDESEARQKEGASQQNQSNTVLSEEEIVEVKGKIYKRVQIEGQDNDFLMDEDQNIYDLNMNKVGEAGDDDDEQDEF